MTVVSSAARSHPPRGPKVRALPSSSPSASALVRDVDHDPLRILETLHEEGSLSIEPGEERLDALEDGVVDNLDHQTVVGARRSVVLEQLDAFGNLGRQGHVLERDRQDRVALEIQDRKSVV